ncbi:MAG: hypothetical protein ACTSYD_02090 [Candidatus Heimdallarchaeaceae archaeon]
MEFKTTIVTQRIKQKNNKVYRYFFIRIPERIRKSLKIQKGESVFLDISEDRIEEDGRYLVVRLWRDNRNSNIREQISGHFTLEDEEVE